MRLAFALQTTSDGREQCDESYVLQASYASTFQDVGVELKNENAEGHEMDLGGELL